MTTTPITATADAAGLPRPRSAQQRRDFIGACIAWCVVIPCVAFIIGKTAYNYTIVHHPPAVFDPAEVPSVELLMTGRVAVGYGPIFSFLQAVQGAKPGAVNPNVQSYETQVTEQANSPLQKLRAAPILGELAGKGAALAELDQITPASDGYPTLAPDIQRLRVIYARGPDALDEADRQALVQRHGWFGQLAVTFGKPATDPARHAALAPAERAAVTSIIVVLALVMAFVAGLALAILGIVMLVQGRIRSSYAPRVFASPTLTPPYAPLGRPMVGPIGAGAQLAYLSPPPPPVIPASPRGGPFIEAFAIYLAGQLLIGFLLHLLVKDPSLAWEWVLLLFIPIPILWPRFRGIGKAEWKRAIGWHTGRGAAVEIGWGVAGYLAGLPVVAAGMVVALLLGKLTHAKPTHPIIIEFGRGIVPLIQVFALACIWAPIVEETMFRGALFHHLRRFGKGWRWLPSALLTSFIFAAIHPQGWTFIPVLGALAFVFAALREWRGSILTSATGHFIQNGVMIIIMAGMLG